MDDARREELIGLTLRLLADVEKAAAFGAHLRALTEPLALPPPVAAAVREVAERVAPGVSAVPGEGLGHLKAMVVAFFRQAADLLEQPDRAPGWLTDDAVVLQAQGELSAGVAAILGQVVPELDDLAARLAAGGAFLDVGTGVGRIAITAARQWPAAHVVGIDIAPRVLALAADNVAAAGLGDRITLIERDARTLDARELGSGDADARGFDLIWLPGPFLPRTIVPEVIAAAFGALRPGGWIAFGTYAAPPDAIAETLGALRTVRSGGHPWRAEELAAELDRAGCVACTKIVRRWSGPLDLVVGRKPA